MDPLLSDDGADSLDPFEQLGGILLGAGSDQTALQRVCNVARTAVPGVVAASVTVIRQGTASTAAFAGSLADDLDASQYRHGHGPCLMAAESGEPQEVFDATTELRWPGYIEDAAACGVLSSLSLPLRVPVPVTGALNLYGTERDAFGEQTRVLASRFATYAAMAVADAYATDDSPLADRLDGALQARTVIDAAKAALMVTRGCSSVEAFDLLVQLAEKAHCRLRDVAEAFLAETNSA